MIVCRAVCTLVAFAWLCYRLYKFLTIPVVKIVSTLKIGTPPATKVSIDRVSEDSITVHWENEPVSKTSGKRHADAISHFLLYVNNLQVAIFPNAPSSLYTCCSITGLESGQEYQLDFVTVNSMGFINKLPSLYCMTKAAASGGGSGKVSGQWRRNTLSVTATLPEAVTASNGGFASPSYANLTSLKDLESFSIDDLKKILVCAQEDLHDVLSQQSSLLQDFQESKLQLELELENLKNYWSHEINLRKSLRSNIKSLENSKLLSDLKLEKINKNIDQTSSKIQKMKSDIQNWSQQDEQQFNRSKLRKNFEKKLQSVNKEIDSLSDMVKACQKEISSQEEKNKELNSLKKNSSSSSSSSVDQQDASMSPAILLKKICDATMEKSGLLSVNGEELISKLNPNSPLAKFLREQLRIDQELDSKWRSKRNKMTKRIDALQTMLNEISITNQQLRTNLIIQPYAVKQSEPNSISNSTSESNSNSNLNLNASISNNHAPTANSSMNLNEQGSVINSPPVSNRSLLENTINQQGVQQGVLMSTNHSSGNEDSSNLHLILHNPSTYASNKPAQAPESLLSTHLKGEKLYNKPFSRGQPDPTTLVAPGYIPQPFPWGREQQQQQQTEIEQAFEYDNASHLISGLQDMIYEETDYPESISNYSKGFTTDQLDNYWTNQRSTIKNNLGSAQPVNFATPHFGNNDGYSSMSPFGSKSVARSTSTPPNLAPNQSLLAATLSDPSMANFGDTMLPMEHSNSFHAMDNVISNSLHEPQSVTMQNAASSHESQQPLMINEEDQLPESQKHNLHAQDHLHAPRFNFMWHPQQSHPVTSKEDTTPRHARNGSTASNVSSNSTWSKLNWKNWSPQASAQSEADNVPQSPPPLPHSASHNQKAPVSPASSGGRRMSRLLSRSGMNNIFKLPSHEEKK
ncbi:hypothetical protein HG536_0B04710 [Torulaspora globosa]|uniref:Fibronectin type-III domain-containing protein n=1 Tax=Torulaspora globosa TaxID=48254 RepID=A0A7G3ZDM1_9SACH|nr:uncharacterized protein HG536_0B04710 [Torulaspora globosa]QLL31607.1 hypothetical protein HG536_0B04710 [Torulaspora globosa]